MTLLIRTGHNLCLFLWFLSVRIWKTGTFSHLWMVLWILSVRMKKTGSLSHLCLFSWMVMCVGQFIWCFYGLCQWEFEKQELCHSLLVVVRCRCYEFPGKVNDTSFLLLFEANDMSFRETVRSRVSNICCSSQMLWVSGEHLCYQSLIKLFPGNVWQMTSSLLMSLMHFQRELSPGQSLDYTWQMMSWLIDWHERGINLLF